MTRCPSTEQLRQFLSDQTGDQDREMLTHLDGCLHCQRALEGLVEDAETEKWHELHEAYLEVQPTDGGPLENTPPLCWAEEAAAGEDPKWPEVPGYEILSMLG